MDPSWFASVCVCVKECVYLVISGTLQDVNRSFSKEKRLSSEYTPFSSLKILKKSHDTKIQL